MRVKQHYLIFSLRQEWNRICSANPSIKPTQYYNYYKQLLLTFCHYPLKNLTKRMVFFYCKDDSNECIIPLVIHKKKKIIRGISHYGRLDYEDIISSTKDAVFIKSCFRQILSQYSDYSIRIENIDQDGLLHQCFQEQLCEYDKCVSIELKDSYEHYLEGVSKHQRQNIRTAYNRLNREGITIEVMQYDAQHKVPQSVWKECQLIYEQRHKATGSSWDLWYTRKTNPYHTILRKDANCRTYVLYHQNEIMAYMSGLRGQECYYVPRLCINQKYAQYSPGIILLNEVIQRLQKEGFSVLDLMQGDEPYKYAMGGVENHTYLLDCSCKELINTCTRH